MRKVHRECMAPHISQADVWTLSVDPGDNEWLTDGPADDD